LQVDVGACGCEKWDRFAIAFGVQLDCRWMWVPAVVRKGTGLLLPLVFSWIAGRHLERNDWCSGTATFVGS